MKFDGKFDAKLGVDGAHANAHHHFDSLPAHAPSDAILVQDAQLLFGGDYKRSGVDLILSKENQELVLHDYFKGEKRVALSSPDGAHLSGDVINALTGYQQFAQADGSASVNKVIGHVTKLTGTATAIRNGVSIILNNGDNVEKGDVVQAGSNSTLGLTFIDGTVFGLSSNARMVLNEMVYDPNGSNNSSLMSLVQGTISFVAGETAKHGDMKVETPVATMGIRGTAVLVEIDFEIPGQSGAPNASFRVLVEPDGTTGSYILFDRVTMTAIATVNQAGTETHISNGIVNFNPSAPLSADAQRIISEVFSQRFTDATNPRGETHFTDSLTPQSLNPVKLADGTTVTPTVQNVQASTAPPSSGSGSSGSSNDHIAGKPDIVTGNSSFVERAGTTGNSAIDTTNGLVSFRDVNIGDRPTVSTEFGSFTYQHHGSAALNAQQLADIRAVEVDLVVDQTPGNTNTGSATWTYNVPDNAFDFLAAGEVLTLTYIAKVQNNFIGNNEFSLLPFTITITGTNDAPVITTGPQAIGFAGGTSVPGGDLPPDAPTSGTLAFNDVDLTDTHTVATELTDASMSDSHGVVVLDRDGLETRAPFPMSIFASALSALVAADSTGTGTGRIHWNLADLPVYLADFIPRGETLTLTYTVTLTDSQGAISEQIVTVTITGTDSPAVVWIATTTPGSTAGGLWSNAANWETGTVPTATDDVIVITDQLHGLTPAYPVTINAPAVAHSVTMNDFSLGLLPPHLINQSLLTIGRAFSVKADAIVDNSSTGTMNVGGPMTFTGSSVLNNAGAIVLAEGGAFTGLSHITNSGTIEVSGGTLSVSVAIANANGGITIDSAGVMTLNGATITGGTLGGAGTIATATGNTDSTLNGVTVSSGTTVTAAVGTLDLTGTIANHGTFLAS
ncbi:MAG: uncharacterized protein JWR80_7227, partial [Bradyrhizobium sp.]|nr:uncharacterized protein [Bradyrhizobium sp.]